MTFESRHLSVPIRRPAEQVYRYLTDPANLPAWAAGLSGSIERIGDDWFADSPTGRVLVRFVPLNEFRVADHDVTLPSGATVRNPMRVLPDGDGCEVVFTVRRQPNQSETEFEADCDVVAADLATLKQLLES
ncbi:MAG TPA: SRPBCC family protein [Jatrophihabitans sp.]|nr:SRPBCC family protein [Jatrophihabitans sp.]